MTKKILALDGGGVRGKFSLQMLIYISQNLASINLTDIFDLIVGVSVGGFIGCIVALGWMNKNKKLKHTYQDLFQHLDDTFRSKNDYGPFIEPRYNGKGKTDMLQRVFEHLRLKDVLVPFVILTSTLGGALRSFKSWDKEDGELYLYKLLDATSAIPVIFPPVQIQDKYYMDGGVIANKCCTAALLISNLLFPRQELKMFNIGTYNTCELKIDPDFIPHMGLIAWLGLGLFDITTGIADETTVDLVRLQLGAKNFYRLTCDCGNIKPDDFSEITRAKILDSAQSIWRSSGDSILRFLLE